ncbi:MAG: hypothetical protein ACOYL5_16885 [Phototrophicaceae bacterium]|jgi:hypothetical protein
MTDDTIILPLEDKKKKKRAPKNLYWIPLSILVACFILFMVPYVAFNFSNWQANYTEFVTYYRPSELLISCRFGTYSFELQQFTLRWTPDDVQTVRAFYEKNDNPHDATYLESVAFDPASIPCFLAPAQQASLRQRLTEGTVISRSYRNPDFCFIECQIPYTR